MGRRESRNASTKANLPSKPCAVCGLPMVWRRKWAKTWEDVRYCSERCRKARGAAPQPAAKSG